MKKILKIFNKACLIAAICLAFFPFKALSKGLIEKKKVVIKTYPLISSDKISLSNKFGEMRLITWDKQKIQITITIIAKAASERRVSEMVNEITIESRKDATGIICITNFKTEIDPRDGALKDEEYSINYEVFLPADNPLYVINKFGTLIVPDYNGEAEIISQHGELRTGRISNAKEVAVEFGRAEIFHINNGHISIRYSLAEINKLSGNITATFEFADSIRISMDNDIKSMTIENTYSTLYLDLAGSFSAKIKINTQLNGVITASALKVEEEVIKNKSGEADKNLTDRRYTVKIGRGERNISIDSRFGKVILGQYYSYHKTTTTIKNTNTETRKTEKSNKRSN